MPNERVIPSDAPKTVATYTILSGGNELSREYHVLSIVVNMEVNRIPSATIIFLDGEPAKQTFAISNEPHFEPGKEIEIKAGYRSNETSIFKGIVIKHAIKVRNNNSVLVVECRDKAVKMTGKVRNRYFREIKDSALMEELIDAHGLESDVAPTSVVHQQIVQYGSTDWDFMMCRCDAAGLLCFTNGGKITIQKPQFGGNAALTIQYGATVLALDAEIDARLQYKAVKGTSWNYTDQTLLEGIEAEDPEVPGAGNLSADTLAGTIDADDFTLYHSGKMEEPELQQWVNSRALKNKLAKIRGRVRTVGTAAVAPGQLIELKGVGDRFAGKLYVTGVRQEVEAGTWQTVFQFGINPEWFAETYPVQQPLAGGLLPPIEGLHIGVATALEDPEGEHRVQVRIPVIHNSDEGAWCRVCSLDAGNNRGSFFLPEIGDEVIVGFINNDPRHGVVLGMVNSSAKPAPLEASDDNHEKGWVTRSELKLLFNDDQKSILIETPGGNKIQISEKEKSIYLEDQNGNKLTMNEDGIQIESSKDMVLKATGDLKAEGVNLELKGNAAAKVEGGSSADFKSGGTTNVKGSMVNIN
ncbi:type VI secretion system tip protein VgrG [Pseudocnuella soli]|uniref:type VI secretion system tip protein VgrG n=1 Tax=Pseudocnuella soli TaxID=2502779 RepID=UPI001046FB1B|nr:type VI secretion system tip protein VgrG [Pseudocnuella soli]